MDKNEVVSNIRACLISTKGRVPLKQLQTDYWTLIGQQIPFVKLGYKNLESFLSSVDTLEVTRSSNGELFINAKDSAKSNHITSMINKQKPAKKKKPNFKPQQQYHQNNFSENKRWRPANMNFIPRFNQNFNRTAAVPQNQWINVKPKIVSSKIIIPQHSSFQTKPLTKTDSDSKENKILTTYDPVNLETFANKLLKNSKQRITNIMSQISLEDNHTSVNSRNIQSVTDPIESLKQIAECYKLGPVEISNMTMKPKKKNAPVIYNCKITVDGESYLSYPNDFYDEKSAQEYCARKALETLRPKYEKRKSLLLSNEFEIKKRVPPMLQFHLQGVWSWQVEEEYIDKYMEQLPSNWLEIIDSCDCVAVEKILERFLLKYCKPGTALQKAQQSLIKSTVLPSDVSIPAKTINFDESYRLNALITCVISLNEIWVCEWNTAKVVDYNKMMDSMEKYYAKHFAEHKPEAIMEGSFYVANYEGSWYRVRILDAVEGQEFVNCFLIDFGDEYSIERKFVYNIKLEFATCQAQAFVCRLAGLEDLYETNLPYEKLCSYLEREVVVEFQNGDLENDVILPVVMYDAETFNSLNEELLQYCMVDMAAPQITPYAVQEVYVSHLTEVGVVYVQIRSKHFENLQGRIREVQLDQVDQYAVQISAETWRSCKEKLYLYKFNEHWRRAKVLDMSPKGDCAQIYFVDHGNFEVVKVAVAVLYPLDKFSDVLARFPAQAIEIKMAMDDGIEIPSNFLEIVGKLMSVDSSILLKVQKIEGEKRIGEFYKRSSDGGLFCVNKSIAVELEMKTKTDKENAFKCCKKLMKLTQLKDMDLNKENVPSGGVLLCPKLPAKNEYFEVNIPFVVNPWNFFVQPRTSQIQLNKMMDELQKCYNSGAKMSPLKIDKIIPGQIYASKHTDGLWYRTNVLKVIHSGSISVFYCDFGYYSSLSSDQMFQLNSKFTALPYQAMKAKLSGIKPKNNKWSMEDCEIFTSMVKGKSFVSVLIDIEKDELYESDHVLKLRLIDTSTDEDVFIEQELVKKNIAVKV